MPEFISSTAPVGLPQFQNLPQGDPQPRATGNEGDQSPPTSIDKRSYKPTRTAARVRACVSGRDLAGCLAAWIRMGDIFAEG